MLKLLERLDIPYLTLLPRFTSFYVITLSLDASRSGFEHPSEVTVKAENSSTRRLLYRVQIQAVAHMTIHHDTPWYTMIHLLPVVIRPCRLRGNPFHLVIRSLCSDAETTTSISVWCCCTIGKRLPLTNLTISKLPKRNVLRNESSNGCQAK